MQIMVIQEADLFALKVSGSIKFEDNRTFRSILGYACMDGVKVLSLDITDVEVIDSAGIAMILIARDVAAYCQKKFVILDEKKRHKEIVSIIKDHPIKDLRENHEKFLQGLRETARSLMPDIAD